MGLGNVLGGIGRGIKGFFGSPAVPAIGSVAAAAIAAQAQKAANAQNQKAVEDQIAFQREQSNTQYQRGVADMRAAGLNPALAYKQGGDSAESGAAARVEPVNQMAQAIDTYNQLSTGNAQRQLIREQAANTSADTRKTMLEGNILQPDAELGVNAQYSDLYQSRRFTEERGKSFTASKTAEQYNANLANTLQTTATAKQQQQLLDSQTTLNEQEFQNAWFRKNISPYINSSAKAFDLGAKGAKSLLGLGKFIPE
jgi:hypothetical protein